MGLTTYQANMGLTTYQDEIIDVVPPTRQIKKKIAVDGIREDRTFIRIPLGTNVRGPSELEKWCRERYKEPKYLGNWFMVAGYIILDEKTYVHWKLCE